MDSLVELPVLGTTMAARMSGAGRPVLLLHGNPTSSYLWRRVTALLPPEAGRLVAVDLVGMGASGASRTGSALDWEALDAGGRDLFRTLRGPDGERMVLEEDFFLGTLLPAAVQRGLSDAELATYPAPYPDAASRRPLLQWAREIPVAGEPAPTAELMAAAWSHATTSSAPKLLVHGDPGVVVRADLVAACRAELPALTTVDVGGDAHFLPEDRAEEVALALAEWLPRARRDH